MAVSYASARQVGRTPRAPTRQTGAWKLAYADFLTALCALFLVLWLVHGVSGDQKHDLAEQFGAATPAFTLPAAPEPAELALAALETSPLAATNGSNVSIMKDGSDIRIELIDLELAPLFDKGEAALNDRGASLLRLAAKAIGPMNASLSIEGHTDSDPVRRAAYSNWDLSSERANAALRILTASGVDESRIRSVAGLADTRPLDTTNAALPQNRRLSIVLHLE